MKARPRWPSRMPAGLKHWRRNGCGATARARKQGVKAVAKALSADHGLAGYRRHSSCFCANTPRADLGADARIIAFDLACAVDQWRMATSTTGNPYFCRAQLASRLLLAGTIALRVYPEISWSRLQHRLPLLLSVPHTAFAVGLFFLIAPSGWLARLIAHPQAGSPHPNGFLCKTLLCLSLALALAIKEASVPALGPWRRAGRARSCPTNGERTDAWLQPPAGLALNS